MTRKKAKQELEAFTAFANGEEIQRCDGLGGWINCDNNEPFVSDYTHRVKPKLAPWGPQDVPPVCWVSGSENGTFASLVVERDPSGVRLSNGQLISLTGLENWHYSTDLKTWKHCVKEVVE